MSQAEDDYYRLLGVDPLTSAEDLRRAWRQLALQCHPDHAGADAAPRFRQLAAAYAVLCDPAARAAYDRRRRNEASRSRPASEDAREPPARGRAPAVMMLRLSGSLDSLLARGIARPVAANVFDLQLDADEWAEGGMAMISMPVELPCPSCSPPADAERDRCRRCSRTGKVRELFSAWLAIRPKLPHGTPVTPSATLPGMGQPPTFRVCRQF